MISDITTVKDDTDCSDTFQYCSGSHPQKDEQGGRGLYMAHWIIYLQ